MLASKIYEKKFMSSSTKRIIQTVIREFWLPFFLAGGFALWGISGDQLRTVQGYFFGFLMLAWFTGQIVRIKREIERKDHAQTTIDKLTLLSEKLDRQLTLIAGHATGGDAYIDVFPMVRDGSSDIEFAASVVGDFPVRGIDITMQDLNADPPWKTMVHDYTNIMWPRELRAQAKWSGNGKNQSRVLIQFCAVNHTATCEAVAERNADGKFVLACRQRVNARPWVYKIADDFPRYDANKPELLFKFDMPDEAWRSVARDQS